MCAPQKGDKGDSRRLDTGQSNVETVGRTRQIHRRHTAGKGKAGMYVESSAQQAGKIHCMPEDAV